jgi:hypothetical protein
MTFVPITVAAAVVHNAHAANGIKNSGENLMMLS